MSHIQTQQEWEEEMSQKILRFVRNELYLELRFMEIALSALKFRGVDGLSALATDGTYLYYSTEPILRIFQKNSAFLDRAYLHSVLHCIFRHLWIFGSREKRVWSLACDIAVEYTIDKMDKSCTKRALSWLRQDTYRQLEEDGHGISAAVIYRWLMEKEEEEQKNLAREFYTDDHRYWYKQDPKSPMSEQAKQSWDKIARQTTMEQKRKGDDPKEGEELLAAQIKAGKSRRSYGDFLKKFSVLQEEMHPDMDEFDMGFYSYGLRLYGNMPLIEPIETRETKKIREFVIVVDTSYSTSGDLVNGFLKETYQILSQKNSFFSKFKIRILQCDDQVQMDTEVTCRQELEQFLEQFTVKGGGSTDFRPAFAYVNRLRKQGELKQLGGLLYFTDGKGIYPQKKPDYKTAFLFLEDYDSTAVPSWAMRLKLEPEEFTHEH